MNLDQERTDELMKNDQSNNEKQNNEKAQKHTVKKKTRGIGMIAGVFALIIIVALVVFIPKQKYKKQLDLAVKYLDEGNYDEAILAYDNAIEISNKNPAAFEGKAEVYIAAGDFKSAQEVYGSLYNLTGEQKYQKKENAVGMGNTSGNLANGGYVLTDDDGTIYEANNPKPGSVVKVAGKKKTEILAGQTGDNSSQKYIMDLNTYKGWIYYLLVDGSNGLGSDSGIYRMHLDGSDNECIYEKPEGNNISNLMFWGNKLYFIIGDTDYTQTNELSEGIYTLTIDRVGEVKDDAQLFKAIGEYRYKTFTCDGQYIYASVAAAAANGITKIIKISFDGTQTQIESKVEYGRILDIVEKDGKIYCTHLQYTDLNSYESNLVSVMNKDGSNEQVVISLSDIESIIGINIDDNNTIYYSVKKRGSSTNVDIRRCSISGDVDASQVIDDTPTDEDIGYTRQMGMSTYASSICFAGGKIFYLTNTDIDKNSVDMPWKSWFSANKDGSNIQPMLD